MNKLESLREWMGNQWQRMQGIPFEIADEDKTFVLVIGFLAVAVCLAAVIIP